jgi:aminomethyltransferase
LVDIDQDIDFIGKEALKKIKETGAVSKLIGVEMDGAPIDKVPENFWPVFDKNGNKVGRLSRCFYSPRLKKNIGLAIVDSSATEEGNQVIVESPQIKYNAIVAKLPWFPAEKDTNLL